jgi:hypothetical protein
VSVSFDIMSASSSSLINRYGLHDGISIVGALNLIVLSILVYLVQTFRLVLCWWPKVYIGIASGRTNMG